MSQYFGIDFSGDHRQWIPGRSKSNIWIAEVRLRTKKPKLHDLCRVQDLRGDDAPFRRLVRLLAGRGFAAAGIDAPFSVPRKYIPHGEHLKLIQLVASIPHAQHRFFPSALDFFRGVSGQNPPLNPPQPLRATETYWKDRNLNVRSTLWAGPRGGAAMTSACLKLLHEIAGPMWPWVQTGEKGLLVEAFPMAQLYHWGMAFQKYSSHDAQAIKAREKILAGLVARIDLDGFHPVLRRSADALDAVICAFAAIAVTKGDIAVPPGPTASLEGWIAVHAR